MSVLTKPAIQQELAKGTIVIEPTLDPHQIREASIDLRLGRKFRVFEKATQVIDVNEAADYQKITREVEADELLLMPQETVLGITMEKVTLPGSICGWLEGRSRFARLGVLVHISAGLIQPGVSNHQVLEITNLSPNVLKLMAGEKICQLAFLRCEGESKYQGKFSVQVEP
jgi:dCTP deaminase